MHSGDKAWIAELKAALSDVPDQDPGALLSRWTQHDDSKPVITLVGAYNTGKTTLLRRLLLEDGREIPTWLTVSARPQTFAVEQVDTLGWTIRDTPGISAGQPAHEARTDEALLYSDAFLIALGPQLLTGEREAILRLLSGHIFCKAGTLLAPGVVHVVVNRLDEAMDPVDNLAGYKNMVARKRESLQDQLRRMGLNPESIPVHFVIADYAGQLASASPDEMQESDQGTRSWDGIHELAEHLRAAAASAGPLRHAARTRFYLWVGQQTLDRITDQLDVERKKLVQLRASMKERTLAKEELLVLIEAARSELDGLIQTELLSLERGAYEEHGLRERLIENLGRELAQWTERYDLRLRRVAEQIGEAVGRAPDFNPNEWLRLAQTSEVPGTAQSEGWSLWLKRIRERWTTWHQAMVRMHAVDWLISAGFGTDTERKRATRHLFGQSTFLQISPWLVELAGLVMDGVQERRVAQDRAQRRGELRRQVEEAARRMATLYLDGDNQEGISGWLDGVTKLQQRLEQSLATQEDAQKSLEGSITRLEQCKERLAILLSGAAAASAHGVVKELHTSVPVVSVYDREDDSFFNRLDKHLSSAEAAGIITHWSLHDLPPGTEISIEIDQRIDQACLILLCISADALASKPWRRAAQRALERHVRGKARVIPILIRPVSLDTDPLGLGKLQLLPRNGQAVSQWSDPEAACLEIATAIHEAAKGFTVTQPMK